MKKTAYLTAWRISFLAIVINLVFSFGVTFLKINDIHISSMIVTTAYLIFAICLILFTTKGIDYEISESGFCRFNPWFIPIIVLFPVAAQFFCAFFTMPVTVISSLLLGMETKEQLMTPHTTREFVMAFIYLCILAPCSEEIIFRGVVYKYFNRHSTLRALFGSALVFSLAHLDMRSFVPIFFMGIALALVRFSTGSVFASMLSHAAINLLSLLLLTVLSSDGIYFAITALLTVSFPFSVFVFLTKTQFPKLRSSGEKRHVSVCMILTVALFVVMQIFGIIDNVNSIIEKYSDRFDYYFNEKEYGNEFPYDIYEDYGIEFR